MEALIIIKVNTILKAHKIASNKTKVLQGVFALTALFYFVKPLFISILLESILHNLFAVHKYHFRSSHNFHRMIVPYNHVGIFAHSKAP